MDTEYPRMLYSLPANRGETASLQDGSYSLLIVNGDEERDAAFAEGWHLTPPEARQAQADQIAAAQAKADADVAQAKADADAAAAAQATADETTPPTRAELEAKATELEIKFDGRTSDKKLRDQIAAALEP